MKKRTITEVYGLDAQDFDARFDKLSKQLTELFERLNQPSYSRLIGRKEAANILGVSLPTLHKYVKQGIVPAFRIGNKVRFYESEVYDSLTLKSNNKKS